MSFWDTIFGDNTLIDVSGVDFALVFNEILGLIPVLLPVTIGFIAVRKGLAFIQTTLRGA